MEGGSPTRRVLMVAFHFPPQKGSSGLQRTLRFVQYLRTHGWEPAVLTVWSRAYPACSDDQLEEVPRDVPVVRAWAWDASRHFAFRGKYIGWMAVPDRWWSWILPAFVAGLLKVRRWRPAVLFSTSPIPSAQVVGWALQRATGLPWIADLRDPLTGRASPAASGWRHLVQSWVERLVARRAARVLFTSFGAMDEFRGRYPLLPRERLVVIENGYDEADFEAAARLVATAAAVPSNAPSESVRVLLHSGLVSSTVRDPLPLLHALAALVKDGSLRVNGQRWRVLFRGSHAEHAYRNLTESLGLAEVVEWLPALPYREALAEMLGADALLLMQGVDNNPQVPAKLYEYARAGRPIIALVGNTSESARWLRAAGEPMTAPLEDSLAISTRLPGFLRRVVEGGAEPIPTRLVAALSREARTVRLAEVLDELLVVPAVSGINQGSR